MKRGNIIIPKSDLGSKLVEAAAIKLRMAILLRELEEATTGTTIKKPGLWRQNPIEWLKNHSTRG